MSGDYELGPDPEGYDSCFNCGGAGGWHDCGEDSCCCADPDEINICEVCHGEGWI